MSKKGVKELRIENRLLRQAHIAQAVASVANQLIKWGSVSFVAWCTYLSIDSLAGRETVADVVISFLGKLTVSQSLAYILGSGGVLYGIRERSLRQKTVERLHARIKVLEKELDPGRSSSRLTARGETNPEDIE